MFINIKKSLGVAILSLVLASSCSDFLDLENPSESSTDNYWNNQEEAEAMLAGCYSVLQENGLYYNYYNSSDPRSLEMFGTSNGSSGWWFWSDAENALTWGGLSPSAPLVDIVWKACYKGIARCNEVIANVSEMDEDKIDKDASDRILAEARFLRAFFYNYLIELYRDVPLVKEPTSTGYIPTSPKKDIVEFISAELRTIAESSQLPDVVSSAERGRVTNGAAWALLARIYLNNEQWDDAVYATGKVMELGYELEDDYLTLFSEAGNTSKEIVFSVRFSATVDGSENKMRGFLSTRNNEGYLSIFSINPDLLNEYYDKDGKPIAQSAYTQELLNDPSNRDPRFGYNFIYNEEKDTWYVRKYQDYTVDEKLFDDQDYYVIRYADVLLMRAEALAQNGGSLSEIEGLINRIRDRQSVKMPHVTADEVNAMGNILNVIKHERRVELALEGHHYFDVKRWQEYAKLVEYNYVGEERSHVWPIPQSELDNNPVLVQATEWGGK